MFLILIQSSNTFFQRQKRFINLSSINFGLFIGINSICTSLTASQINETHLGVQLVIVHELHHHDGVGAGRLRVGAGGALGAQLHPTLQTLHDVFNGVATLLGQVHDVDRLVLVLATGEFGTVVQQVLQFAAINFVEGQVQLQVCILIQQVHHVICS